MIIDSSSYSLKLLLTKVNNFYLQYISHREVNSGEFVGDSAPNVFLRFVNRKKEESLSGVDPGQHFVRNQRRDALICPGQGSGPGMP